MKFFDMIYNFFDKILDFLIDYEDLVKAIIFGTIIIIISFFIIDWLDRQSIEERQIIENTKDYVVYDRCRQFDNKFYCYNLEDKKD